MAREYGVVSVTGPRQSGKTTLVKSAFPKHEYINFENLAELENIKTDPIGFINSVKDGIIIDEVQKYPDILSYIQLSIDEDYHAGKFIITGSQNLLLSNKVSQSLAGRVAILKLLPLSIDEMISVGINTDSYVNLLLQGFYPGVYDKNRTPNTFYTNYLNTYIERDVRTIQNVGDLSNFTRFMQILAGRIGQLLNLSEIGSQIGVNYKTIDSWISILEASYIIKRLEPYYINFGKRITKSPKIYFIDVGVACNLLRLDNENEISNYHALGSLFENLVIMNIYKRILNNLSTSKLYYFRDKNGNEVDLLIDKGNEITPIEVKSSETFNNNFVKGLNYFNSLSESQSGKGYLVYSGKTLRELNNIKTINYQEISKISI